MKTLQGFTYEFLDFLFVYDRRTGLVTRRIDRNATSKAGDIVGTTDGKGYLHVNVAGKFVRLHRLGYFLTTGEAPPMLDHHDRNKQNNAFLNLRPAARRDNAGNVGLQGHNTSGYRGVSRNSKSGKWHAQIKLSGKQTYLGRFDTPEEAALRYNYAAKEHFGEFAVLNGVPNA